MESMESAVAQTIEKIGPIVILDFVKFVIDDFYALPAKSIIPYGLWFDFLTAASTDPNVQIDRGFYEKWEPYENGNFIAWWPSHAHLFAINLGVRVCETKEIYGWRTEDELIVRVPLYQRKRRSLQELSKILDEHHASDHLSDMRQGEFQLNVGVTNDGRPIHPATRFLRNLEKMKLYLLIYQCWLQFPDLDPAERLEETAFRYRDLIEFSKELGSLLPGNLEQPSSITEYTRYLETRGAKKRLPLHDLNESDNTNHRRQIARYIQKARRIAANVGRGIFPGNY